MMAMTAEDMDLATAARKPNRARLQAILEKRYSPRLHMALILTASGFISMVVSWALLTFGVESMLLRYPVAISASYGMFLFGVWVWLRLMGLRESLGILDASGPEIRGEYNARIVLAEHRGGGGAFDGGGASAAWAETTPAKVAIPQGGGGSKGGSFFDGFDLDGDGLALVILALLLVLAILFSSGYLVFYAPEVLAEAAFGAALTGSLAKRTARESADGWMYGVVKKTWGPYAIVLVLALVFAGFAAHKFPQAKTFKQAIAMATKA